MIGLVGLRIREQRKQRGITQAALARRAGISPSYLNLIEADKRAIGGTLLRRIASELEIDLDLLEGTRERQLADNLAEAAATPELAPHAIDPATSYHLVSRHPDWARGMLALWRDWRTSRRQTEALERRLDQDPALAATVYSVMNMAATIRSTSEILDTVDNLSPGEHDRFVDIILEQSHELSRQATMLAGMFEAGESLKEAASPAEEVDDLFIGRNAYFAELEEAADRISTDAAWAAPPGVSELRDWLENSGIRVVSVDVSDSGLSGQRRVSGYDPAAGRLHILESLSDSTRTFQLARAVAFDRAEAAIEAVLGTTELSGGRALDRARSALASYVAAAILMPYRRFRADAIALRYDIERLCRHYHASVEQVALRLVSLREPGNEGLPFGLLRADASGHIGKRFPLPGLPLPGAGTGCPLLPVYAAQQTPGRFVRQLAEFPNGGRFLLLARTLRHETGAFDAAPVLGAIMLACDVNYADQTVYGDDMALTSAGPATPVGPTCTLCARHDCRHRNAESALATRKMG